MKKIDAKKFVDFCKKPILIASAVIFAVFLIAIIVVSCLPHANSYTYKLSIGNVTGEVEIRLDGDKLIQEMRTIVDGEVTETDSMEYSYVIEDGNLYTIDDYGTRELFGDINVYRIKDVEGGTGLALECVPAVNFRTTAIVFIVLSGVVLAGCIAIKELDKRGKIKYQTAKVEDAGAQSEVKAEENKEEK